MPVTLTTVQTPDDLSQYVRFPWQVYRGDPNWVPPLISDRIAKLDPGRNSFWRTAERQLWIAWRERQPVGTIGAILDHHRQRSLAKPVGVYGFFECLDDPEAAAALFDAAAGWLKGRGMGSMTGPYNPDSNDEPGILVEGFETRPALLEAHHPRYYQTLFETNSFTKNLDTKARLFTRTPQMRTFEQAMPEKLLKVTRIVEKRTDLRLRQINMKDWDNEVHLACQISNAALAPLPGNVPMQESEFVEFANSFKPLIDPRLALIAEVGGKPVGYALALPDYNEVLQRLNGRLGLPGLLKFLWYRRRIRRVSFKLLMMLPEYQKRGFEAALVTGVSRGIWDAGFPEVDASLTGEENMSSWLYQDHIGLKVYRSYRIYDREL
jgi:GNAT superfamily N-acetyltransferase